MIIIYNTLTKTKEKLIPREDKKVNMFVCGPTVYDYIHIGNARTFVFFDVVAKYLRFRGYGVNYIQNITDIDDKIIQRAQENKRNPLDWAKEYENKFKEDMVSLKVDSPRYENATEHISEVVSQVKTLIKKNHAYFIENDGWYFDLSTFPEYGKLSGRKAEMADDAVSRIDESDKKRNRGDFCLWKISKEGEPAWDFETGQAIPAAFAKVSAGRPGWHIEDTAITEKHLGQQYDLHGGGQDLIFPHHEAEITQQESASGKKPFVKYWIHVAPLVNKEQKMSKSLGNFKTVRELLKKYPKETLRFYLLSGYYRSPLEFSDKVLRQSEAGVRRMYEFVQRLKLANGKDAIDFEKIILKNTEQRFLEAMDNDFHTPEAFSNIFEMIKDISPFLVINRVSKESAVKILKLLEKADSILGIIPTEQKEIPAEVQTLVEKREKLRQEKNYSKADKIRAQIFDLGWKIEDTAYGPLTIWVKNSRHFD